jgi:hypothetical protein
MVIKGLNVKERAQPNNQEQLKARWSQMQRIAEVNKPEKCNLFPVSNDSAAFCRYETASAVFLLDVRRLYRGRRSFVPEAALE